MQINEMQKIVDDWISQFKEGYWDPKSMTLRLCEEIGELSREVNHLYGQKTKKPGELPGSIEMELGDILFVVTCFANSLNINLEQAFSAVMEKYRQRDSHRWTKK